MDYVAKLYSMSEDKISQEIMNLHKKLATVNGNSPIYNQLLEMVDTAESIRQEKMIMASLKEEDKTDSVIDIGSVESVVYTPIYSQEEFLEVVAKMYLDKGKK
jgi:hypothetical protein